MGTESGRMERVERNVRIVGAIALLSVALNVALLARGGGGDSFETVTVRSLRVVDASGVERVSIGAPLDGPGDGERVSRSHGIAIRDGQGMERFAVGLLENGLMGMGFDAAPGVGDSRNRERLFLGVTSDGRGFVTVKDNGTRVRSHLGAIDEAGTNALMFVDWSTGEPEYVGFGLEEARAARR